MLGRLKIYVQVYKIMRHCVSPTERNFTIKATNETLIPAKECLKRCGKNPFAPHKSLPIYVTSGKMNPYV
jgi:hypothetical protein